MKKNKFTYKLLLNISIQSFLLLFSITLAAQNIGINTKQPLGVFHVDSKENNPKTGIPSSAQQIDDFVITDKGNIGIGTIKPENKLHIVHDPNHKSLTIEGLSSADFITNNILVYNKKTNNVEKSRTIESYSIPTPTVFKLNNDLSSFLKDTPEGRSKNISMIMIQNSIKGLTYNNSNSTITFPKGTYQFIFSYEAIHNNNNCNLSSYFINFPFKNTTTKIHSTASHFKSHNNAKTINYVTTIPNNKTWQIHLGRGRSGNCSGLGMTLLKNATQLIIYRIGD